MTPRRRRWRPDCSTILLALAVTAAGAVVVAHEIALWVEAHTAALAAVLVVASAGGTAWRRRGAPATTVRPDLVSLDPAEFEHAVAALCRRDGCRDVRVIGGAGDLGADILAALPDGRRIVVQCKRYAPGRRVGSPEVQRVGGTYAIVHRADLALVVTTASYTEAARDYAAQAGIQLVDGQQLATWSAGGGRPPWA